MPLVNFFSKMNLTNHTIPELEKIIWESLPAGYNVNETNLSNLVKDSKKWQDFSNKFLKNLLSNISPNLTNYVDHIYEKLKHLYQVSNHSNHNLTQKLEMLGEISTEILKNKDFISDFAKKIHLQLRNDGGSDFAKQSKAQAEVKDSSESKIIIGVTIGIMSVLFIIIIVLMRRYYKKRSLNIYNQMETTTQLNT